MAPLLGAAVHQRHDGQAVAHEVGVREHNALGLARGAACVDERGEIVRAHGGGEFVERPARGGLLAQQRCAQVAQVSPARDFRLARGRLVVGVNALQRGKAFLERADHRGQLIAGGEHELGPGIRQDELAFLRGQRRVDRHVDRTELQDGQVDKVPLRAVGLGDVRHAVALTDARGVQAGGPARGRCRSPPGWKTSATPR